MLNHILIHFERFHDIAENIRKWEGAIATCSDTLTAGFHLTVNQRQNRSNLALVKLDCWHCHRQIYHHRLSPLPCISRVRNRFAGQKRLFLTFNWQKGQKQHAGNRFWDSVWANDRCVLGELVIMISDCAEIRKRRVFRVLMVFACCFVLFACAYAWIDCSLKIQFWNVRNVLLWVEVPDSIHTHFFEQQGHIQSHAMRLLCLAETPFPIPNVALISYYVATFGRRPL